MKREGREGKEENEERGFAVFTFLSLSPLSSG